MSNRLVSQMNCDYNGLQSSVRRKLLFEKVSHFSIVKVGTMTPQEFYNVVGCCVGLLSLAGGIGPGARLPVLKAQLPAQESRNMRRAPHGAPGANSDQQFMQAIDQH